MVYFKVKALVVVLLATIIGCENDSHLLSYSESGINERYCFGAMRDTLNKFNNYDAELRNSNYHYIKKVDLLKLIRSEKKVYLEQINSFFDFSSDVETYLIENKESRFLILVGGAIGATGIGVAYWNYQIYSLDKSKPVVEFSSLIKTPYSSYVDTKGRACHIEVDDDYPRPAGEIEIKLDYKPILITVFREENKEASINFHCK